MSRRSSLPTSDSDKVGPPFLCLSGIRKNQIKQKFKEDPQNIIQKYPSFSGKLLIIPRTTKFSKISLKKYIHIYANTKIREILKLSGKDF